MTSSLVGSEMCIRDSYLPGRPRAAGISTLGLHVAWPPAAWDFLLQGTVSYTHLTLPTICSV
eukprot:4778548-Prorocentrum_lima.AAC.1